MTFSTLEPRLEPAPDLIDGTQAGLNQDTKHAECWHTSGGPDGPYRILNHWLKNLAGPKFAGFTDPWALVGTWSQLIDGRISFKPTDGGPGLVADNIDDAVMITRQAERDWVPPPKV